MTFSGLSDHLAETITLSATAASLLPATSSAITITPGVATHVAYVQQPSNASGGSPITPAVSVELLDQFENRAASTANVTLTFGNNPSGGALSGASVNAVNGLATFPALSVNTAGTGYTLVATSGALPAVTSNAFDITVGSAAKVAFSLQPTNTAAGQPIAPGCSCRCRTPAAISSPTARRTSRSPSARTPAREPWPAPSPRLPSAASRPSATCRSPRPPTATP